MSHSVLDKSFCECNGHANPHGEKRPLWVAGLEMVPTYGLWPHRKASTHPFNRRVRAHQFMDAQHHGSAAQPNPTIEPEPVVKIVSPVEMPHRDPFA